MTTKEPAAGRWMIYGANGYTGRLCTREAVRRGLEPILAGRNAAAIEAMADEYRLDSRVFPLGDHAPVWKMIEDVDAVLHLAGPFSATARPMLEGCVRAHTHYLDVTGEIGVFEYVHQNGHRWRDAGIVVLPGVGFDVVPSDCLAAMLKRELPDATHLRLAFKTRHGRISPGTAKTVLEGLAKGCWVRRDGALARIPVASITDRIPFRDRATSATVIPWCDVSTAFYSTGIPNIEVLMGVPEKQIRRMRLLGSFSWLLGLAPVQAVLKRVIAARVKGPTDEERARDEVHLYGEVTNAAGDSVTMTMHGPETYTLTADAAVSAVQRILSQPPDPGPHTPATAFGPDFALSLEAIK